MSLGAMCPDNSGRGVDLHALAAMVCASGLWAKLLAGLARGARGELRHIDCSHIKVHHHGTNPCGGQAEQAIGRSKGGDQHQAGGGRGRLRTSRGAVPGPGPSHDLKPSNRWCPRLVASASSATKASMQVAFGRNCAGSGRASALPGCAADASPCPSIAATTAAATGSKTSSPDSNASAAVATRYDKLAVTFLGFVQFAAILDWLTHEV